MKPFLDRLRVIVAKEETTPGVSADPLDKGDTFANPINADVRISEGNVDIDVELDDENSSFLSGGVGGKSAPIPGAYVSSGSLSIKMSPGEFREDLPSNPGTFTHKMPYDKYLRSCSLNEAVVWDKVGSPVIDDYPYAASRVYYPSLESSDNTITITELYKNVSGEGIADEAVGCMSTLEITAGGTGQPYMMNYTPGGSGETFKVPQVAADKVIFDAQNGLSLPSDKFQFTSISIKRLIDDVVVSDFCSNAITFAGGQETEDIRCQSGSGIAHNVNVDFEPRLTINPLLKTLTAFDYWKSVTEAEEFEITVISKYLTATGVQVNQLFIPKATLLPTTVAADGKKIRNELVFRPIQNSEKAYPVVAYFDTADGITPIIWDGSDLTDDQKLNALFYFIATEIEKE
jgi:hypothetical protein